MQNSVLKRLEYVGYMTYQRTGGIYQRTVDAIVRVFHYEYVGFICVASIPGKTDLVSAFGDTAKSAIDKVIAILTAFKFRSRKGDEGPELFRFEAKIIGNLDILALKVELETHENRAHRIGTRQYDEALVEIGGDTMKIASRQQFVRDQQRVLGSDEYFINKVELVSKPPRQKQLPKGKLPIDSGVFAALANLRIAA